MIGKSGEPPPAVVGSVAALVEDQVAATPQAPAVVAAGVTWTYRELDDRAERVAGWLRRCGAGRESFVALCLDRSPEYVAGLLGIWKAGAVAVPLPSGPPSGWMTRMATVGALRLGLYRRGSDDGSSPCGPPEVPGVDDWLDTKEAEPPVAAPIRDPDRAGGPDDAAYVVYTSGSTGEPKGIVGLHRGVLSYFADLRATGWISAGDRVLQLSAATFDASLRDMIFPLTVGARVVIAAEGGRNPAAALEVIATHGITAVAAVVPQVLREMVREAERRDLELPAVGVVLVSGDRLYGADVAAARRVFPRAQIANMYGPSECTMTATRYEVEGVPPAEVPVGWPIRGMTAYVLDGELRPVPTGMAGDVYLAGPGLTRGYWNRPAATAERFVPNPFGVDGERMYRTGDRARLRLDSGLEFLGRVDDQVKVRGQRVELGAVEAALRRLPTIREAACRVWDDEAIGAVLAAYLTADNGRRLDPTDVRAALAAELPEHLLPSVFVQVDALPRTAHGKVDRQALPTPSAARLLAVDSAVRPRTETEHAMARLWCEVLDVSEVGVHDSFFALGGHSLLVLRLVARIQDVFDVELALRAVFDSPTVAALAAQLDEELAAPAAPAAPAGTAAATSAPATGPLSPAQAHVWHTEHLAPGGPAFNVTGLLRLRGRLDVPALERAMTEVVRRHEPLHTRFPLVEGEPTAVVSDAAPVGLPVDPVAPGEDPHQAVRERLRLAARSGFDLIRGPVFRVGLIRVDDQEHYLYLVVHHIAFDGWSMRNFVTELTSLYEMFADGRSQPLPALATRYRDVVAGQLAQLRAGAWAKDIDYWRGRFVGASRLIDLPAGYPITSQRHQHRALRRLVLDAHRTRRLLQVAAEHRATPSIALLTAYQVALFQAFREPVFLVATPVANRVRPEVAELIGFVANTHLLRADMSGDPTLTDLLQLTRDTVLDAYTHDGPPLEAILDGLSHQDDHTPDLRLAQVMFNMQEALVESVKVGRLTVEPADTADAWARYPVALYATRRSEQIELLFVYDCVRFHQDWADTLMTVLDSALVSMMDYRGPSVSALCRLGTPSQANSEET
ncbi:amino acid adenylation domain-containing protein [Micromonospora sp. SCSIO 07396]